MKNEISNSELRRTVISLTGCSALTGKNVVDQIIDDIGEALLRGDSVRLNGVAKLSLLPTAAKEGRNPATGETIQIPAGVKLRAKLAKQLKDKAALPAKAA